MFECGLEGIKLKVVKRSQFEKGENGSDNKKVDAEIFYTDSVKSQEELDNAASTYFYMYIQNQMITNKYVF